MTVARQGGPKESQVAKGHIKAEPLSVPQSIMSLSVHLLAGDGAGGNSQ